MNMIEITMEQPNVLPKIVLNGQVVKDLVSLQYNFESKTSDSNGYHNFIIEYFDRETATIREVSVRKFIEGKIK